MALPGPGFGGIFGRVTGLRRAATGPTRRKVGEDRGGDRCCRHGTSMGSLLGLPPLTPVLTALTNGGARG